MVVARHNLNIQALRAMAALAVVVGHASGEMKSIGTAVGRTFIDLSFFNWGIGVDIFFIISGYIMVHSSANLFRSPGSWRVFLVRRLTRIVPLYWLLTTLMLIGAAFAPKLLHVPIGDWQHVVASYLFIPSARTADEIRPVMALGWTLNMEMFFYVLFACALTLSLRAGMIMLVMVMASLATIGFVIRPEQVQLAFWTQPIILEFLLGCLLAVAALSGARLSRTVAAAIAGLGIAGVFIGPGLAGGDLLPNVLRWGLPAFLIVAASALSPGLTARSLMGLAALGDASYSLYLVHPFVLRPLRTIWIALIGDTLPPTLYIAAAVLLAALTGLMLYRWIERPMLAWLQTRLKPSPVISRQALAASPALS